MRWDRKMKALFQCRLIMNKSIVIWKAAECITLDKLVRWVFGFSSRIILRIGAHRVKEDYEWNAGAENAVYKWENHQQKKQRRQRSRLDCKFSQGMGCLSVRDLYSRTAERRTEFNLVSVTKKRRVSVFRDGYTIPSVSFSVVSLLEMEYNAPLRAIWQIKVKIIIFL